jgi:hypothetical protein
LCSIVIFGAFATASAQISNQPEQNCSDAIPICSPFFIQQELEYQGYGTTRELQDTTATTCGTHENNSVWYKIAIINSGQLEFTLTPSSPQADFDWVLYNITSTGCSQLTSMNPVSCNYSVSAGVTGLSGTTTQTVSKSNGTSLNGLVSVSSGQEYVLMVDYFGGPVGANRKYSLDFRQTKDASGTVNPGGVIGKADNIAPQIDSVAFPNPCANSSSMVVYFSEKVLCTSINTSDFAITAPNGSAVNVNGIVSTNCNAQGGYTQSVTLNIFPSAAPPATYSVAIVGSITDVCGNSVPSGTHAATLTPLDISISTNRDSVCTGLPATLTANASGVPPFQYSWSPSLGLSQTNTKIVEALPSQVTDYVVRVTDKNDCIGYDTIRITPLEIQNLQVNNDTTICPSDSVQLTAFAQGATGYSWFPPTGLSDTNIANPMAKPTATTSYIVTAYNTVGCEVEDTVTVTVEDLTITLNADTVYLCSSSTVPAQLSASGGVQYSWTPTTGLNNAFAQSPTANPDTTTLYTVTVVNAAGCTATDSILVRVVPDFTIVMTPDTTICQGDTIEIAGSALGATQFRWSPSQNILNSFIAATDVFPDVTTTYTLTAYNDDSTCSVTDSVTITIKPRPTVNATPSDTTVCIGDTIQLSVTGNAAWYQWVEGNVDNSFSQTPKAVIDSATMFIVEANGSNGCRSFDTVFVDVFPQTPFTISPHPSTTINAGGNVQLTATPPGAGFTFSWTPANSLSNPNIPNPVASPLSTQTYYVTMTDANGCKSIDSVEVVVNGGGGTGIVAVTPEKVAICLGDSVQLEAFSPTATSFEWSPGTGLSDSTIFNPVAFPDTSITYTVSGINGGNVISTATVEVTVIIPANVTVEMDTLFVCRGDSVEMQAYGGGKYSWTPSSSLSTPFSASTYARPDSTTEYTVTVSDDFGKCSEQRSVFVYVGQLPEITLDFKDTVICRSDTVQLGVSGGYGYRWEPVDAVSNYRIANPLASPDTTTQFIVKVHDLSSGCPKYDTVTVHVLDAPALELTGDTAICRGDSVQLLAKNVPFSLAYLWYPSTGMDDSTRWNPTVSPDTTTRYTYRLESPSGCVLERSLLVTVLDEIPLQTGVVRRKWRDLSHIIFYSTLGFVFRLV